MKKHGNLLSWVMVCLLCLSLLPAGLAESKADQPPLYYDGYDIAVVQNPDPLDRLHFRAKAYGSAKSLGKTITAPSSPCCRTTRRRRNGSTSASAIR